MTYHARPIHTICQHRWSTQIGRSHIYTGSFHIDIHASQVAQSIFSHSWTMQYNLTVHTYNTTTQLNNAIQPHSSHIQYNHTAEPYNTTSQLNQAMLPHSRTIQYNHTGELCNRTTPLNHATQTQYKYAIFPRIPACAAKYGFTTGTVRWHQVCCAVWGWGVPGPLTPLRDRRGSINPPSREGGDHVSLSLRERGDPTSVENPICVCLYWWDGTAVR